MVITPNIKSHNADIEKIFTVINSNDSLSYYQNSNLPFMLILMSNHPNEANSNALSIFTPDYQINCAYPDTSSIVTIRQMHQHNYFEFMYILKGSMYQLVEGKRYLYTAGSCCVLNRNTMHTEETHTEYVCIFFSLSVNFLKKFFESGDAFLFSGEKVLAMNMIYHFLHKNLDYEHQNTKDFLDFIPQITETEQKILVHNIFEKMIHTMMYPYYGATYNIQNLFCQMIGILCDTKYYNAVHVTTTTNMKSMIFARINQLLDEYNGRISNNELSKLLNYSGSYLSRVVKKNTGMSLFDYSMSFTMRTASNLLINTKKSVSEIAEDLHFSNRTHFYKIFLKHYSVTPKEYRKIHFIP